MNKERFYQIIDEVYNKYLTKYVGYDDVPPKELFLFEIKNNTEFSERWGLKIEERELSDDELNIFNLFKQNPTKLITLTYNNETIESYE